MDNVMIDGIDAVTYAIHLRVLMSGDTSNPETMEKMEALFKILMSPVVEVE